MKEKISNIFKGIFSIFLIIAILGGGIVFGLFVIGIIIGGSTGESLGVMASKTIMPYFIRSAAIAMFAGLLSFYIENIHGLHLNED